ncbi:hypothetical protein HPB51_003115 [Rhipicephalus microplus]|uniref:Tick transposon n=1 Tax=Rhipicephalus microplus TaxID=6941 RepID=A0A9J6EL43_RHIMP|nr:hypothetical protein HPB51_003115 [Rhipicephalus microplus]
MHRTYESYAAEIHFRKHLRLADQMIEFHWKLQLRLLRDLVDKVRVSATSNVHVAEGICLPDFVLEVLGLGPKFAVQPQKNKPELVSIVRQVSKRVPEDQATRIINEDEKTCWCYEPRASKPLLQFHSAHTKLVKRGIAKMCLSEALKKSCRCLMNESFRQQVSRLSNAGYPKSLVVSVAEGLHRKVLEKRCEGMDRGSNRRHRVVANCSAKPRTRIYVAERVDALCISADLARRWRQAFGASASSNGAAKAPRLLGLSSSPEELFAQVIRMQRDKSFISGRLKRVIYEGEEDRAFPPAKEKCGEER